MIAAYSGSLIQQNFGESLFHHGYLLYTLDSQRKHKVEATNIKNSYGFVKLVLKENDWFCEQQLLSTLLCDSHFPENLNIRMCGEISAHHLQNLKFLLKDKNYVHTDFVLKDDTKKCIFKRLLF